MHLCVSLGLLNALLRLGEKARGFQIDWLNSNSNVIMDPFNVIEASGLRSKPLAAARRVPSARPVKPLCRAPRQRARGCLEHSAALTTGSGQCGAGRKWQLLWGEFSV